MKCEPYQCDESDKVYIRQFHKEAIIQIKSTVSKSLYREMARDRGKVCMKNHKNACHILAFHHECWMK